MVRVHVETIEILYNLAHYTSGLMIPIKVNELRDERINFFSIEFYKYSEIL